MIEYISGRLTACSPAHAVVECGGLGYLLHISLYTYARISKTENCKLFVHEIIREDAHELYGFADDEERWVFRRLISVSGVGAGTGRMIISALNPSEVRQAILAGQVNVMKAIKGIGQKTAERIIVDLRDKMGAEADENQIFTPGRNTLRTDALSALSSLGFDRARAEKVLDKLIAGRESDWRLEDLVKLALKQL